jgi:hypothetical protein
MESLRAQRTCGVRTIAGTFKVRTVYSAIRSFYLSSLYGWIYGRPFDLARRRRFESVCYL